jgi:methylglutaconyl-CoA hydratase
VPGNVSGENPSLRIRFAVVDGIARITLARPAKRNALSPESIRQLRSGLDAAGRDASVRVIVLAAEGPDFCAGADLEALAELVDASEETHRADARALADLFLAMRSHSKPIIAAVQGRALAGGAGLVTACDIAIASEAAAFGYPEVRIGFVAAVVTALLRVSVGEKPAFELLATGRQISADEAQRIGLVTRVVPAAELDHATQQLAREIAALPPDAVTRTKRLFHEMAAPALTEAFDKGVEANVSARATGEFRVGLANFVTRRRERGP